MDINRGSLHITDILVFWSFGTRKQEKLPKNMLKGLFPEYVTFNAALRAADVEGLPQKSYCRKKSTKKVNQTTLITPIHYNKLQILLLLYTPCQLNQRSSLLITSASCLLSVSTPVAHHLLSPSVQTLLYPSWQAVFPLWPTGSVFAVSGLSLPHPIFLLNTRVLLCKTSKPGRSGYPGWI